MPQRGSPRQVGGDTPCSVVGWAAGWWTGHRTTSPDVTGGYGIGLLALAWFSAPLIRYADAIELARCGLCAFFIVLTLERSHRAESSLVRQVARGAFFGVVVMTLLSAGQIFFRAREMAWHNDRRCAVIEREMLRGTPRRNDLADMFQAFGCRPQSDIMPRRP